MTERAVFGGMNGSGWITTEPESFENNLQKVSAVVAGKWIDPGDLSDLNGHLAKPFRYAGAYTLDPFEMIFYLAEDGDLFENKHYYLSVYLISQTRLYEQFSPNAGRDFNWINGKWK